MCLSVETTPAPILSSNQIHRLHHTFYIPNEDIKATLLVIHGMCEHSGRYDNFAKWMAKQGVLVATFDLLGHGNTVKDKFELGFFDKRAAVQTLSKDVILMSDALDAKAQSLGVDVPKFIMGHSMGSLLLRVVLRHHASRFDGAILMGTVHSRPFSMRLIGNYLKIANMVAPKKTNPKLSALFNQYLSRSLKSIDRTSPLAWISADADLLNALEHDPLCGFDFSHNSSYALYQLLEKATDPAWCVHIKKSLPFLLLSGEKDAVGNMGKDIKKLEKQLKNQGFSTKSILYPNTRHELINDKNHHTVYGDILRWMMSAVVLAHA